MRCPFCNAEDTKVLDSRPADGGVRIRRRRECIDCEKRFTTYEIVETVPVMVEKKDGSREAFDRQKILNGLLRACEKRPVTLEQLDQAIDKIEQNISNSLKREISSLEIGELCMEELRRIDEVAYVRFASVYRQFGDLNSFMQELTDLLGERSKQCKK